MRRRFEVTRWIAAGAVLLACGWLLGCGGGAEEAREGEAPGAAVGKVDIPELSPDRNKVIGKVNDSEIYMWQLNELFAVKRAELQAQGIDLPEEELPKLKIATLGLVVDSELMHQAALAEGLTVDPRKVEQRMLEASSRFASEADFKSFLQQGGFTEDDVRREAEYQLLVEEYRQSITGEVKADEALARDLYEKSKEMLKEPEKARAAYILVKSSKDDPEAQRADARSRIQEAYDKLLKGEDFAQVAREYSQAPNAAKGGDVGFFPRGVMVPQFEELAFNTPVGEMTEIFETAFGYNILKVLDRKEDRQLSFEEVKPNLMLMVAQQQENEALMSKLQSLREGATIEITDDTLVAAPAAEGEAAAAEEQAG